MKTIYVTQYGAVWKLTAARFKAMARIVVEGGTCNFDEWGVEVQPKNCRALYRDSNGRWCSSHNDAPLYRTLDWTTEDWADALAEVTSATQS